MALLCTFFSLQDNTLRFAINLSFSSLLWNEAKLLASQLHLSTSDQNDAVWWREEEESLPLYGQRE